MEYLIDKRSVGGMLDILQKVHDVTLAICIPIICIGSILIFIIDIFEFFTNKK